MRELPILFSASMVRAILDGRKTVTRRVVKLRYPWEIEEAGSGSKWPWHPDYVTGGEWDRWARCPYGKVGDRLYVRETTEVDEDNSATARLSRYTADKAPVLVASSSDPAFNGTVAHWDYPRRSRPGIHLPKAQSRIWLEVTGAGQDQRAQAWACCTSNAADSRRGWEATHGSEAVWPFQSHARGDRPSTSVPGSARESGLRQDGFERRYPPGTAPAEPHIGGNDRGLCAIAPRRKSRSDEVIADRIRNCGPKRGPTFEL